MKAILTCSVTALLLFTPACARPSEQTGQKDGPPKLPDHFVLRPQFITQKGTLNAGTAFPIEIEGQDRLLILTAVHLFGPAGGLSQQIPSSQLPGYVNSVSLSDAFSDAELARAGPMLELPDAAPWSKADTGDVAAFWTSKGSHLSPGKLAESPPKPGETVWLAAALIDGPEREQKLHRAVVRLSKREAINFQYDTAGLNLVATSGAPLLDSSGKVIGINVGVINMGDKVLGTACPVTLIRPLLNKALDKMTNHKTN